MPPDDNENRTSRFNDNLADEIHKDYTMNPWRYVYAGDVSKNPYFKNNKEDVEMKRSDFPVNIENAEKVEINFFNHPDFADNNSNLNQKKIYKLFDKSESTISRTKFEKSLEITGKIFSIISGIAIIIFIALLLLGKTEIGQVNISNLLTIFSFTLIGGLISVGGVKIFSISASLRKTKEQVEKHLFSYGGCPFVYIIDEKTKLKYQINNPFEINDKAFCNGCFMVDHNGMTECNVSPFYKKH